MAVASLLSTIENFEGTVTFNNIGSGGGAALNTDVFIEGIQSAGRRCDNATDKGFMATVGAVDLSAAREHVKVWIYCFHWSAVTALTARFASGTTAYDNHVYPTAKIPNLGGWIPVWVDISRTPDSTGTTGLNEAAVTDFGAYITIGNVGGAGDNFIIDEIMHGTSGYRWTSTGGTFNDFATFEASNAEGVFLPHFDAYLCFARLEIGSATATTFTDSGFTITFPDQALVASDFMGITVDLQNASSAVDLSNGAFVSGDPTGATNRFDIAVTGLSGTFAMDTVVVNGARTLLLNAACSVTNCVILNSGVVDATNTGTSDGATLNGSSIIDSTVAADASALIWDVNADVDGSLDDMTFVRGANAHHGITLGTNSPTTVTFRGLTATGFNASDGQNDSFFYVARTTGTVTINVIGGTGNFKYKSAGATVVIVLDPVTFTVTAIDSDTLSGVEKAYVTVWCTGTGPFPSDDSVSITSTGGTATVTHTAHGLTTGDYVRISGASEYQYNGFQQITVTGANTYTYAVSGSPASPATGSPVASLVLIRGYTNSLGQISDTRTYSGDQDVTGQVQKGTSSPVYRPGTVTGTVDSGAGLGATVVLSRDE